MQKKLILENFSREEMKDDIEFLLGQLLIMDHYQDKEKIDSLWIKYKIRNPLK